MPDAEPLCELRGVSHEFRLPDGRPLRVLQDVNLTVRRGEVVALLGQSGCGKSTLLRILAGLIRPTGGEVLSHNKPLNSLNPGVAIVFQTFALLPWLTVADNVRVVLRAAGLPPAAVEERSARAVNQVGLGGFEEAFPRELSGGMKQRVGMARALSVDPEVLLMDEPFSHLDALTAESLRAEVLDLWAAHHGRLSSVLMVSHDIKEVAFMADRIVLLASNPGRVRTVLDNTLPRPRDYRAPGLAALVDKLHDAITSAELPDVAAPPAGRPLPEPLPDAAVSEVTGLLELLDSHGGQEDLFRLAALTNQPFGRMIAVVKAAEMLDLVDTPRRLVVLDRDGRRFVQAGPEERQALWKAKLLQLGLFREVRDALERAPRHEVDRDFVLETIILQLPQEDYERQFEVFVGWARYADLFGYDEATETLRLA
jgi:NitT/TauT family transport system ATP-binding protein